MAIFNYYKTTAQPSESPSLETPFYLYAKVRFADRMIDTDGNIVNGNLAAGDDLRVIQLKDHWIITDAWYRVTKVGTVATSTVDVGVTQSGAEIVAAANMYSAGDWIQGITGKDTAAGTTGAHLIQGADGYVWLEVNHAARGGEFEILLKVVAGDRDSTEGI